MSHIESCKSCKQAFLKALQSEFGEVTEQWSSGWPCKIEDLRKLSEINKSTSRHLETIYNALIKFRGHNNFVKVKKLPRCDYYVKNLNCLVEFDESQHFTAPRNLTLSLYPQSAKLGFSKREWKNRCVDLDRHDNHPPNRDETRAWYDALRDILPIQFGMNPTIRVVSKYMVWCTQNISLKNLIKEV